MKSITQSSRIVHLEGGKYTTFYVYADKGADKCNIIVTPDIVAVHYYNTAINSDSGIYDNNGALQFGVTFCIPDDITEAEVHALMTKKIIDGVNVWGDCIVLRDSLRGYMEAPEEDEAERHMHEGMTYKCIAEIAAAIDDHFGMSLQDRGCPVDWCTGVRCVGRPEDIAKLPRIDDDVMEELEERHSAGLRHGM